MTRGLGARSDRRFAALLAGTVGSRLGTAMSEIALAWLVMQLTGSTLAMGTVAAAADVPAILLLIVGGVLADQGSRTRLLTRVSSAQALVAGVLALLVTVHRINFGGLVALTALAGGLSALYGPTLSALKAWVMPKDRYEAAVGLWEGAGQTASLVGPVLGGLVVATAGVAAAFWMDALSFMLPAGAGLVLSRPSAPPAPTPGAGSCTPLRERLTAGVGFLRTEPGMFSMIALFGVTNGLNDVLAILAPFRIRDELHLSAAVFGVVMAAMGGGAVLGALAWARWGAHVRWRARWICAGLSAFGLAIAGLALVTSPLLLAATATVAGAGFITAEVLSQALWIRIVPDAVRGRVIAVASTIAMAANPVGYVLAGVMGATIGVVPGLLAGGAAIVAVTAAAYAFTPLSGLNFRGDSEVRIQSVDG